jgi:putative FmdB family regulatory protein
MPTYEYECKKCGHAFELFQSITAPPRKKCPKCSGKVERLISGGGGIIFKGHGFYATDYRSDSYRAGEKKEKESSKPEKKDSKKEGADAKGAGKASSKKD